MKSPIAILLSVFFLTLFFLLPSETCAQETAVNTADFVINIEINNNEVLLKCTKGCDWKTLKATPNETRFDATGAKQNAAVADAAGFLISVSKNEKGVVLNGLKGTSWTALPLGCKDISCKLAVNQHGLLQ